VLSLATTLLTPLAASAEQNYWAPANGELTLKGHGFGHGRGMSQYGAQGAAGQGLSWRQILSFYYPGTSLGQAAGQIRVLITDDQSSNVRVSAMGGTALRLRDLADGKAWVLRKPTASTDAWELNVNGQNQNIVRYHDRNGWKNWKVPGRGTLRGDAEFYSANPIELRTDRGRASYRGNLRMVKVGGTSSKRRDTVNVVGLENYVRGVVPDEMPASWRQPALAAQAVAARTYAVRHRGANPNRYYHVDDTISYQVYGGASAEDTRADRAISLTKGTIVTYGGAPALTEFSSSSGGWTAGSNLPYQVYKKDPYDAVSGNPNHTWQVKVRTSLLERAYPGIGTFERLRVLTMPGGGEFGGRVGTAELIGTKGSRKVTGDDLRRVLGLKSNWFRPLDTPIIKRWRAIGGWSSVLGAPQAREYVVAGGNGQAFKGGYMYHSAATGTHPVHGPVFREYRRLRGASGVLKLPTTDIVPTSDGAALRASFQAGVIYSHETLGTHGLYGPIERAYAARRWTVGPLGLPKSSVKPTTERDGHVAAFQHGAIYNRPDLGAHALYGPIYQAYASTGWTTGPLGMPSTGVGRTTALDAQRTSFVGGVIYYRRDVGAHALHGPIYDAYARQGWTTGYLGLPTTDVTVVPGGLRADFEHGWIMWDESTDRTTIHRSG
jgi:SpoIID/LytB domain protein